MKTVQLMKREFIGNILNQRTNDKFFNATELLAVYNSGSEKKKVLAEFWSNKNTLEFIEELENEIAGNIGNSLYLKTHDTTRGKNGGTWMHPYLFVKFAMWLSPRFEIQMIKWVYDNLIDFRIEAGDFYTEMCSAIMNKYQQLNQGKKPNPLIYANEANFINSIVYGKPIAKKRNESTEIQLKLINDLQKLNIKLISGDINKGNYLPVGKEWTSLNFNHILI